MRIGQLTTEQIEDRGGVFLSHDFERLRGQLGQYWAHDSVAWVHSTVCDEVVKLVWCQHDGTAHWHLCAPDRGGKP